MTDESRSVQRRKAAQRGEPAPQFDTTDTTNCPHCAHQHQPCCICGKRKGWPGFCQSCYALLYPPDLTWCPTCGSSDEDET